MLRVVLKSCDLIKWPMNAFVVVMRYSTTKVVLAANAEARPKLVKHNTLFNGSRGDGGIH